MTLAEKQIDLKKAAGVARYTHVKAKEREERARHELRLALSASETAYITLNIANKQVTDFKAFYTEG